MGMGTQQKKIILFASALFLLALMVCDGIVGIYTHYFVALPAVQEGLKEKLEVVAHPYKSYINKPGTRFFNLSIVNEFGHQVLPENKNIATEIKEAKEYRVLFLGGSTTFQQWPFYTVDLLNKRIGKKKFKAINAGTGGYTSQENVIDLIICGFSYSPDMVVAYLPINDIFWSSIYPDFKRDYTHMRIPLQIIDTQKTPKPEYIPHTYPFTLNLVDILRYKKNLQEYMKKADLAKYEVKQPVPWPEPPQYKNYDISFRQTVEALIDNIFTMKTTCDARGIRFVLLTQKLFPYPYGYGTKNKHADMIDELTFKAIKMIKRSKKLKGAHVLEMQGKMPNQWDRQSINLTKEYFPDKNLDFTAKLAYDDMHFNDAALNLFAVHVYQYISNFVR